MVGRFFVEVVQAGLLFGSETWVMNPQMEKSLEGFRHRLVRRMADMGPKRQLDGTWVYSPIGEAMATVGLDDIGLYITLPPEHGHTIHCNSSYHGLVSGSGA